MRDLLLFPSPLPLLPKVLYLKDFTVKMGWRKSFYGTDGFALIPKRIKNSIPKNVRLFIELTHFNNVESNVNFYSNKSNSKIYKSKSVNNFLHNVPLKKRTN